MSLKKVIDLFMSDDLDGASDVLSQVISEKSNKLLKEKKKKDDKKVKPEINNLVAKNDFNKGGYHTELKGKRVPRHVSKRDVKKQIEHEKE